MLQSSSYCSSYFFNTLNFLYEIDQRWSRTTPRTRSPSRYRCCYSKNPMSLRILNILDAEHFYSSQYATFVPLLMCSIYLPGAFAPDRTGMRYFNKFGSSHVEIPVPCCTKDVATSLNKSRCYMEVTSFSLINIVCSRSSCKDPAHRAELLVTRP